MALMEKSVFGYPSNSDVLETPLVLISVNTGFVVREFSFLVSVLVLVIVNKN
jgi:hypothetical protein